MTAYVYECLREHRFDEIHPIGTAPETTKCPEDGTTASRVISAPALSFPGGSGAGYVKR